MSPDIPAPPQARIARPQDLGPDPEPLGVRAERLLQRCAPRKALNAHVPPYRDRDVGRHSTRRPHVGAQRGRHR
jgi:hypothetical protein